jgi:hypothetical protein
LPDEFVAGVPAKKSGGRCVAAMCSHLPPAKSLAHAPGSLAMEGMMADSLINRGQPDRSKINMTEDHEVRYWCKHLGITRKELQAVIDKVGNSVKAVEKELGFDR